MIVNITYTPNDCKALITSVEQKMCINISEIGSPGLSAYQLAVANGFVGTEIEWLDSLKAKNYIRRHEYTNDISYCGIAVEGSLETDEVWKVTLIYVDENGDTFSCVFLNVAWSDRLDLEPCWGLDPDATAFLNVTGITDATIQSAINTLVVDLKSYGIWDKMKAIYPFCGGTATTHKFNLKDARDSDAAFRLAFFGGWTHSSTGATPNGTNGYADTFITSNLMSQNSAHLSIYSRTNSAGNFTDIGCTTASSSGNDNQLISRFTGNINYSTINTNLVSGFSNSSSDGLNLISRITSSDMNYFRNNTKTIITRASIAPNTIKITIGARNVNNVSRELYSSRQIAFTTIGDGLTDTEASNLYTAVQKFQTTLSRQV
jgi:hypothetical protein